MDPEFIHLDEWMGRNRVTADHLAAIRRKGHPLPVQNMVESRDAADWLLLMEAYGIYQPDQHRAALTTPAAA